MLVGCTLPDIPSGAPAARPVAARRQAWRKDLALLGSLAALAPLAWYLPERHWPSFCAGLVRSHAWRCRSERLARFGYVDALSSTWPGLTATVCARRQRANIYRERLQLLRCYRSDGGPPSLRLDGREQLAAVLAGGRGAILWVGPFVFSDLLTKIALHDAGFAVSHLSRYAHGFSGSDFGVRVLNPIRTRIEQRFLAERLVMTRQSPVGALRELRRRLDAGRPVSVSAIGWAEQLYRIPFLNGTVQMAGGAPSLAIRSGAPLLPVFTGRDPDGQELTVIEPPLMHRAAWPREEAITRLLLQYAALLEYYVTRWPDQFRPNALLFEP